MGSDCFPARQKHKEGLGDLIDRCWLSELKSRHPEKPVRPPIPQGQNQPQHKPMSLAKNRT
jgi:hypothetical protein